MICRYLQMIWRYLQLEYLQPAISTRDRHTYPQIFTDICGPCMGMAFSWRGCSLPTIPPPPLHERRSPLLRTRGYLILRGNRDGSAGSAFMHTVSRCVVASSPRGAIKGYWVIKGLGMYSRVYATGHIKDPVPLIAKKEGGCLPMVRFRVRNKSCNRKFSPWRWP